MLIATLTLIRKLADGDCWSLGIKAAFVIGIVLLLILGVIGIPFIKCKKSRPISNERPFEIRGKTIEIIVLN